MVVVRGGGCDRVIHWQRWPIIDSSIILRALRLRRSTETLVRTHISPVGIKMAICKEARSTLTRDRVLPPKRRRFNISNAVAVPRNQNENHKVDLPHDTHSSRSPGTEYLYPRCLILLRHAPRRLIRIFNKSCPVR